MHRWPDLLRKPRDLRQPGRAEAWFARIAKRLLNGTQLLIAGKPHRFLEIEFYCHSEDHPDPFTYRDPLQHRCGRWYVHRTGGVYVTSSFKGLDLSFGNATTYGGILIRSIATADGTIISGPSRLVDHVLAQTGSASVASLDEAFGDRDAWDADNPLSLHWFDPMEKHELLRTARVGLSLRKAKSPGVHTRFIMEPYRYLREPRGISKGKPQIILALHMAGADAETIRRLTGSPSAAVRRCIAEFEAGLQEDDFSLYLGKDLGPRELCRVLGLWQRCYSANKKMLTQA